MSMMPMSRRKTGQAPNVSFEFFPPKSDAMATRLRESVDRLEPMQPSFVSVTYGAGGTTRQRTLDTVRDLARDTSLNVAAHLTCVDASREDVLDVADTYFAAGIRRIVALRGDPPNGVGARFEPHPDGFESSVDLVAGLRERAAAAGLEPDISVGCYPERHNESRSLDDDLAFLKAKQEAGATRAVTQFFFEPETFLRFRDAALAAGVTLPIVPGIMLQSDFKGLTRFAAACNAHLPDWLHWLYEGLEDDRETRDLVTANVAAELCNCLSEEGVDGFHFYTLNRAGLALSICHLLGLKPAGTEAKAA